MKFYNSHRRNHIIAISILLLVVGTMSFFSHLVVKYLTNVEQNKMKVWAEAYRVLWSEESSKDALELALPIIGDNKTIPIITVGFAGNIESNNIKLPKDNVDEFLQRKLEEFKNSEFSKPLEVSFSGAGEVFTCYIYYGPSTLLRRLSYFPLWQVSLITFFMALAYYFFILTKRSEENRVWVGLSKETAHQLGTPISSLLAWVDLMRSGITTPDMVDEMQKDITRLQKVSNRFSKIGSVPTLEVHNLCEILDDSVSYMSSRIPQRIKVVKHFDRNEFVPVLLSSELIEWVIENLIKNAVDAMRGSGEITISMKEEDKKAIIDFTDQGKGIPKNKYKAVFQPGYSSKKRGWGLGLSFAKRIIKDYHGGKIFVKKSEVKVGTTFRIILPKEVSVIG